MPISRSPFVHSIWWGRSGFVSTEQRDFGARAPREIFEVMRGKGYGATLAGQADASWNANQAEGNYGRLFLDKYRWNYSGE